MGRPGRPPQRRIKDHDQFGNHRQRVESTELKFRSMRDVLKNRLIQLGIYEPEFLDWLWPFRKTRDWPRYPTNTRYFIKRRGDAPGLPRFSIDHYLADECRMQSITTSLPPIKVTKNDGIIVGGTFKQGRIDLNKGDYDRNSKKSVRYISSLNNDRRKSACDAIKRDFVDIDGRTPWKHLFTDDMLRRAYQAYKYPNQSRQSLEEQVRRNGPVFSTSQESNGPVIRIPSDKNQNLTTTQQNLPILGPEFSLPSKFNMTQPQRSLSRGQSRLLRNPDNLHLTSQNLRLLEESLTSQNIQEYLRQHS